MHLHKHHRDNMRRSARSTADQRRMERLQRHILSLARIWKDNQQTAISDKEFSTAGFGIAFEKCHDQIFEIVGPENYRKFRADIQTAAARLALTLTTQNGAKLPGEAILFALPLSGNPQSMIETIRNDERFIALGQSFEKCGLTHQGAGVILLRGLYDPRLLANATAEQIRCVVMLGVKELMPRLGQSPSLIDPDNVAKILGHDSAIDPVNIKVGAIMIGIRMFAWQGDKEPIDYFTEFMPAEILKRIEISENPQSIVDTIDEDTISDDPITVKWRKNVEEIFPVDVDIDEPLRWPVAVRRTLTNLMLDEIETEKEIADIDEDAIADQAHFALGETSLLLDIKYGAQLLRRILIPNELFGCDPDLTLEILQQNAKIVTQHEAETNLPGRPTHHAATRLN